MEKKIKYKSYWKNQRYLLKKHKAVFWFIIPAMILTLIFSYIPMLGTLISFKEDFNLYLYNPIDAFLNATWTFGNYVKIFQDANFFSSVKNTLLISGFKILIVFPFTVILAIMLAELKKPFISKLILIVLCLPHF